MNTSCKTMRASAVVFLGLMSAPHIAEARGGPGGGFMNSPGYQRRLQESRGFVTTYSNGYPQRGPLYYYRHRDRRGSGHVR